jgi:hypothetical protein
MENKQDSHGGTGGGVPRSLGNETNKEIQNGNCNTIGEIQPEWCCW